MKIQTTLKSNDDGDTRITVTLTTEEQQSTFSIGEGEPEDMTLYRDLTDAYAVPDMLRAAYQAGKNGEPLEDSEENAL